MRMPVTQCVLTPDRIIFSASHMSLKNDRNLVVFQVAVERFLSSHPYILIGTSAHFQSWFRHFFFFLDSLKSHWKQKVSCFIPHSQPNLQTQTQHHGISIFLFYYFLYIQFHQLTQFPICFCLYILSFT